MERRNKQSRLWCEKNWNWIYLSSSYNKSLQFDQENEYNIEKKWERQIDKYSLNERIKWGRFKKREDKEKAINSIASKMSKNELAWILSKINTMDPKTTNQKKLEAIEKMKKKIQWLLSK